MNQYKFLIALVLALMGAFLIIGQVTCEMSESPMGDVTLNGRANNGTTTNSTSTGSTGLLARLRAMFG